MKTFLAILLCAVLAVFGIQRRLGAQETTETTVTEQTEQTEVTKEETATPKKKKRNAAALVTEVQKANAYVIKHSEASAKAKSGQLNPKKKAQRPYWSGLKTISTKSESMKKAVSTKDKKFFKLLSETGLAVTAVNDGAQLMQLKDKDVLKGIKALSIAYNELYRNYGKEALRKKKGGNLTKKETDQFTKLQTKAETVETKLKSMRKKVAAQKKKNPRLLKQLDRSIKNCSKIRSKKNRNVSTYSDVLTLSNYLRNDWRSIGDYSKVWYPTIYSDWTTTNASFDAFYQVVEETYVNIDISVSDMTALDQETEVVDVVDTYDVDTTDTEVKEEEKIVDEYSEKDATEENTKEETEATEETESTTEETNKDSEEADTSSDETTDQADTESNEESYDPSNDSDGDGVTNDQDDDSSKNDDSANDDSANDDSKSDEGPPDNDNSSNDDTSSNDDNSSSNDNSSNDDSNNSDDDSSNDEPPPES